MTIINNFLIKILGPDPFSFRIEFILYLIALISLVFSFKTFVTGNSIGFLYFVIQFVIALMIGLLINHLRNTFTKTFGMKYYEDKDHLD
jgi:hypothetical protein